MASMCSLAQHTTEGWSTTFVGATIGQDSLETWSRGLELFNAERSKHDSAQFYDMDYFDFIADPVRELEAIYRHFGIDFTDAARAAMEETHAESKKGPRAPKHTYFAGRLRPDRRAGQGPFQGAVAFSASGRRIGQFLNPFQRVPSQRQHVVAIDLRTRRDSHGGIVRSNERVVAGPVGGCE